MPSYKGYHVIGNDNDFKKFSQECYLFIITIGQVGSADVRRSVYQKITEAGSKFAIVIAPLAVVSSTAKIGEGTIVMHQAIVNADALITEARTSVRIAMVCFVLPWRKKIVPRTARVASLI